MIPYWAIFLTLAIPAMMSKVQARQRNSLIWSALLTLLILFIGYRHQVGGDWSNYIRGFLNTQYFEFNQIITQSDPGYKVLNWQLGKWGYDIHAVNLVCGAIFAFGLVAFARRQPYPWLALTVAFPYMILVVGMGYTRQGVAIGFIMLSLNALQSRQFVRNLTYIVLATLFHSTALVMIPLGFFMWGKGWILRAVAIVIAAYVLFDLLVAKDIDRMWVSYVDAQMASEGARIRVLMNLVPSILLLAYWKNWQHKFPDYWFWFWIAIGSVISLPLVGVASTAVDRLALYFIPIQIVVFSHLPVLLRGKFDPVFVRNGIVVGYAVVLFVWLNYATHARFWIPYQNYLFQ